MDASRTQWPPEARGPSLFGWILYGALLFVVFGVVFKLPLIRNLDRPDPSVWRFGAQVALLMVTVPLAAAAWKAQASRAGTRFIFRLLVVMYSLHSLMILIGSQSELVKGSHWRPGLSLQLLFALVLSIFAFGQRRVPASLK